MNRDAGVDGRAIFREHRQVLRLVTLASVTISLWSMTTGGNPRLVFAMRFGATDWQIGLLGALPELVLVFQVFFVRWVQRHGKRRILVPSLLAAALVVSCQALLPIAAKRWNDQVALWMLIGLAGLGAAAWTPGLTTWFPLLNDCIPEPIRGRFFARMRTWWLGATMGAMLLFILWIGRDREAPIVRYQVLFGISFVWAAATAALCSKLPESTDERKTSFLSMRRVWAAVFRDRRYLLFLCGHFLASGLWMTLLVFTATYVRRGLGYAEWLVILSYPFAWALGSASTLWLWGELVDRAGSRAVFTLTALGLVSVCGGWAAVLGASAGSKVTMAALSVLGGAAWSGYYIAATRQCFLMAPRANQTPYMAAWTTMRGLGFSLAPLAAGAALGALERGGILPVRPGVWHVNRYTLCFLLLSAGFLAVVLLLRRVRTPGEMRTRQVATRLIARLASWR